MPLTDADRLRQLLGEVVPAGGNDADTMFSDGVITDLLSQAAGNANLSALNGWRIKMAEYANLVDTAEGSAKRAMSDLHKHAKDMVEYYSNAAGVEGFGGAGGRARIGRIVRS